MSRPALLDALAEHHGHRDNVWETGVGAWESYCPVPNPSGDGPLHCGKPLVVRAENGTVSALEPSCGHSDEDIRKVLARYDETLGEQSAEIRHGASAAPSSVARPDSAPSSAANGQGPHAARKASASLGRTGSPWVSARDFIAIPRQPLDPYLSTPDGRTVLLAAESVLLFAGPSGLGKSLAAAFDLGGRLADDEPSEWLGLRVRGGLRALLLSYEGEGSDEDVSERLEAVVPASACERFGVWDRWRREALPRADEAGISRLAAVISEQQVDVVLIDTGSAFFRGAYDCSKGIPEEAIEAIARLRELSGRRFACVVLVHTRKVDRVGGVLDQLEEIAGTFHKKADAALVMRRDGGEGSRRLIHFAKVRRGPEPPPAIATLPEQADHPPRLEFVGPADARGVKRGTAAPAIAEWVRAQPGLVSPGDICERFDISAATLRDRRPQLEELGVIYQQRPGAGNAHAYGSPEQWAVSGPPQESFGNA